MIQATLILATVLFFVISGWPARAEWPQFLGPDRNGSSTEKIPLRSDFADAEPQLLWKHDVGAGHAGPVVVDDTVFIFHRTGNEAQLEALAVADGKQRWVYRFPTEYRDSFGFDEGPRSSPTVSGGKVFIYNADGQFHAVDASNGKGLWKRDFAAEMDSPQGFFGRCGAPLVVGKCVMAQPGGTIEGKPAAVIGMDVETGKTLWQAGSQEAGYASPVVWKTGQGTCGVFFLREGLLGVSPETGRVWFDVPHRSTMNASVNAATPIVLGEDRIFTSACYGVGAVVWKWDGKNLGPDWKNEGALDCHYGTPVFTKGCLFGLHGRQETGMEFRCVDAATGKVRWTSGKMAAAEIIQADGKFFLVTETGELIIAAISVEKFESLANGQILGAGHRSPPALAGGILFSRDKKKLVAVDLRK